MNFGTFQLLSAPAGLPFSVMSQRVATLVASEAKGLAPTPSRESEAADCVGLGVAYPAPDAPTPHLTLRQNDVLYIFDSGISLK